MKMCGRTMALLLVLALLMPGMGALADVVLITGDCHVRRGPGTSYESIDILGAGETLEYWDETATDDRGVDWYNVIYGNVSAWVSSKCAELVADEYDAGETGNGLEYAADEALAWTAELPEGGTDLMIYLGADAAAAARSLSLPSTGYGGYDNDILYLDTGDGRVEEICLRGEYGDYSIQGLYSGMGIDEAHAVMDERGWRYTGTYTEDTDLHQHFFRNDAGNEIDLYTYDMTDYQVVNWIILTQTPHDWE